MKEKEAKEVSKPTCVKCKNIIKDVWLAYQKYTYRTIKGKDKTIYLCWDCIIVNENNI